MAGAKGSAPQAAPPALEPPRLEGKQEIDMPGPMHGVKIVDLSIAQGASVIKI